jgi:hypothetical protein
MEVILFASFSHKSKVLFNSLTGIIVSRIIKLSEMPTATATTPYGSARKSTGESSLSGRKRVKRINAPKILPAT